MNRRIAMVCVLSGLMGMFPSLPGYSANMVENPGVETGTATTAPPWEQKNGGSSFSSSQAHNGSRSIRLVNDYTGVQEPSHDVTQRVTGIVPGKEYVYYVWVKGDNVQGIGAGGKPMGMLTWKTASGGTTRRWLNMHAPYGTYTWRQMTSHCEAPANATQCDVYVRSWWDCTDGFTYWDDFWLEERDFSHRGSLLATHQAESGTSLSNCSTSSEEPDYTGTGYVVPNSNSAHIQWNAVNVGAGERYLAFRYSIEAGSPTWEVLVNGVSQGTKVPVVTSSPESWATIEWTVTLSSGDNTVRLRPRLGVVGPWIDKLDVYSSSDSPPMAPTNLKVTPSSD